MVSIQKVFYNLNNLGPQNLPQLSFGNNSKNRIQIPDSFEKGLNTEGDGTRIYSSETVRQEGSGQKIREGQIHNMSQTSNVARSMAQEYDAHLPDFRATIKKALDPMIKDESIRVEYRAKSVNSLKEKLTAYEIFNKEDAQEIITDGLGARIVMKDAGCQDAKRLVETLIEGIKKDPKFVSIDEVKDYCPDPKYSFLNKQGYSILKDFIDKEYGISIDQKSKKSGYTATHIIGRMKLKESKGAKLVDVPFEIQITSENVLKLCGPEHELFKIFGNKAVEEEFFPLMEEVYKLSKAEKKEYLDHVIAAYTMQRLKDLDPKGYAGEKMLPIPSGIFEEADPEVLDLNNVARIYRQVERRIETEKEEERAALINLQGNKIRKTRIPRAGSGATVELSPKEPKGNKNKRNIDLNA